MKPKKSSLMKKIFLLAVLCVCFCAIRAQHNNMIIGKEQLQKMLENKNVVKYYSMPQSGINIDPNIYVMPPQPILPQATLIHTLPNGNTVYALPQDHMPCVVPNLRQFNMPVIVKSVPKEVHR